MLNIFARNLQLSKAESEEEGFTLVELMIVVVIIGILAAIAIPVFANQQKSAADAALKSDIKTVALAQNTYIAKNPTSAGTIDINELKRLAPNLSTGSTLGTWVTAGKGFCIAGLNTGGTYDGGVTDPTVGKYLWYDSALGGIVKNATTGTPPTGGACEGNPRPQQAWYYGPNNPTPSIPWQSS